MIMGIRFTAEEDKYIKDTLESAYTLYDLVEGFNSKFTNHQITYENLGKRISKLGLKKGTHNIRKEKVKHRNPYGTIIKSNGKASRIKTEQGYVSANQYFRAKLGVGEDDMLINLNGDKCDFSESNIEIVPRAVYFSMCWRGWFFDDAELTKAAILTAKLLQYFPDLRHNENQCYGVRSDSSKTYGG